MRENELNPIREELYILAEPMLTLALVELMLKPTPEPKDHANYVIKYAYEWPGVHGDGLALRRLRMATFRNFKFVRIEPRRLTWKSEAEISVGGEMLFGGNCLADADLFEKYDGHLRRLKPSEREHYQRLYGFLPEEVKAFRDNKDLILSINRAASVELKPELYEREATQIKEKVKYLHSMAQEITEGGPDVPLGKQEHQREVFRWCLSNIELHWARLIDLAAKRGQLNDQILEAVAQGGVLLLLVLAGLITTIGAEDGDRGGSFPWSHRARR
jgi:hypothetical protein